MKRNRPAALILTLALVLLPLLAACSRGSDGGSEDGLRLSSEDLSKYTIIRSDLADQTNVRNGIRLREALVEQGCEPGLGTDFYKEGSAAFEILDTEILVGDTNRPETADFLDSLAPWQWGYDLVGTKIVIAGHNSDATASAVDAFISKVVNRAPLGFSHADRYVFGDIPEGEGRVYRLLTAYSENGNGPGKDEILSAVRDQDPEIVVWVKYPAEEEPEPLSFLLDTGYAVGYAGCAGGFSAEIYYWAGAYTFSAGESAVLLDYPKLSEEEKGALVYSVLRCRETGKKMIFAASRLPEDASAAGRMKTVASFLKYTVSYPVAIAGFGLGPSHKEQTVENAFFEAGYTPSRSVAVEKTGDADPSAAVFLPYERLAADASRSLAPGLCMTVFREAKRK